MSEAYVLSPLNNALRFNPPFDKLYAKMIIKYYRINATILFLAMQNTFFFIILFANEFLVPPP